jgi:hypothetical protein
LAPAEWSFSTYVRPFKAGGSSNAGSADASALTHAVEEVLWGMFLGGKTYDNTYQLFQGATSPEIVVTAIVPGKSYVIKDLGTTSQTDWNTITGVSATQAAGFSFVAAAASTGTGTVEEVVNVPTATQSQFNADLSNKATLGTADIFFVLGDTNRKVYKLKDCVINEASLDFDIDGIATINWSGMSSEIVDMTLDTHTGATPVAHADTNAAGDAVAVGDPVLDSGAAHRLSVVTVQPGSSNVTLTEGIFEGAISTTNFIRNRLTQLTVVPTANTSYISNLEAGGYLITLTGGNITMSNNVTFITPEELGIVNTAIGHVTGTRSVSGSMTCYLSKDTGTTTSSADLWEDLKSISTTVTNSFALDFKIGGTTANTPRLQVSMPTCHLEIPTHSIEDVISVETNFNALPSAIDGTNEATITYFSKA